MSKSIPFDKNNYVVVPNKKSLLGLPPQVQVVHFWIAVHSDNATMQCWPSFKTLAKECGMSRRSVMRAIDELVEKGLLKKEPRKDEKQTWESNLYTLLVKSEPSVTVAPPSDTQSVPSAAVAPPSDTMALGVVSEMHSNLNHITQTNELNTSNDVVDSKSPPGRVIPKSLFDELVKILGFSERTSFTDARKQKLRLRLKRFTPDELRQAAKELGENAYMQGDNPAGKRWGTVDYLLRSDENMEKYLLSENNTSKKSSQYDKRGFYIGGWEDESNSGDG